jgi:hypothetical protein
MQSEGQYGVLHWRRSTAGGHFRPSPEASLTISFVCVCQAPPHERGHTVHGTVTLKMQSSGGGVGHTARTHDWLSVIRPHVPPNSASTSRLRERV